jgi:hypothetical protein
MSPVADWIIDIRLALETALIQSFAVCDWPGL